MRSCRRAACEIFTGHRGVIGAFKNVEASFVVFSKIQFPFCVLREQFGPAACRNPQTKPSSISPK